ncbi:hypothetical protein [Dehalogenimonas sp. 4OHTPN]|uniref:Uncharacterized protein n=1 Tax=Dehalogenimonas sp. 4OHTPN TaxID=3166643 RepID=A0AAU8GBW9_9CHLR
MAERPPGAFRIQQSEKKQMRKAFPSGMFSKLAVIGAGVLMMAFGIMTEMSVAMFVGLVMVIVGVFLNLKFLWRNDEK